MLKISVIVAMSQNRVIGDKNCLLWHLPDDLKMFKELTVGHTIVMGRKTYQSIGKALPNRRNIVISRQAQFIAHGCWIVGSPGQAIQLATEWNETELFIIGGGEVYRKMLPFASTIYLTEVHTVIEGDTTFPNFDNEWKELQRTHHPSDNKHAFSFDFVKYQRQIV